MAGVTILIQISDGIKFLGKYQALGFSSQLLIGYSIDIVQENPSPKSITGLLTT